MLILVVMKMVCKYAVIAEGAAEKAVIDILFDNEKLIFKREEILEGEVLTSRSASNFAEQYLSFKFEGKITVYRILDSRKENFKIPKEYEDKFENINVITRPEIEILVIIAENLYDKYKKSKEKPSVFIAKHVKTFNKSYDFYKMYFNDVEVLVKCIVEYNRITRLETVEIYLNTILT